MATLQTKHTRRSRWDAYNATPSAHARRSAAREAASIAGPAPAYPSLAPLHGDWLGGCINGHTIIMRLMRDPQHRSDQWAAEIDGVTVAGAAGLVALLDLLRPRWAKAPSRRTLATMTHPAAWVGDDDTA